jgi:two-component system NarL family sensor kinase
LPAISLAVPVVLLFPTGRLPSWRWRPALWASVAGTTVATIGLVVIPILVPSRLNHPLVPLHGSAAGWLRVTLLGAGMCLVAACCAAASVVGRWRSSSGLERQQLMWLGPAAMVAFLSLAAEKVLPGAGYLGLALIPVALAVAILRFGLYDLYLYLNRTLVYGALTLALVPFYVLVAALAVAVFGHGDRLVPSLVATGAVAAVFQPARYWLQRGVDRMVYGERGDPFRVVATLGHTLGDFGNPQEVLARVVETISCALQLPFAAVDVVGANGPLAVAGYGRRVASPVDFPMVHQGANVGSLLVATRAPRQQFGTAERRLLETLADQIGPVAKSVALTNELRRSRERLVRSREEERRRLRRDLHDGLGPILSGLRLGIEGAARGLPPASPLLEALGRLGEQAVAGRDEVRRLIDDLRPGVLDSLGIIGAIEDATTRFSATQADGHRIRFEVVARDLPPDLPAAVEVAAYWIVNEAIHNVVRHANAQRCTVSLVASDKALEVLVVDDGDGIGSADRAGVGLASMRERAEEIGGVCWIENGPQRGTRVAAHLPVGQP